MVMVGRGGVVLVSPVNEAIGFYMLLRYQVPDSQGETELHKIGFPGFVFKFHFPSYFPSYLLFYHHSIIHFALGWHLQIQLTKTPYHPSQNVFRCQRNNS